MDHTTNIGVLFGSRSPEHDVSIITGTLVISALRKIGYRVTPIYIGTDGTWHIGDELGSLSFYKDKSPAKLKRFSNYSIDLAKSNGKLVFCTNGFLKKTITVDIAFPAFHGQYGEDGTIQGLFEMLGVPYVGCDVESSAITMDKVTTKLLYQANNIPTTPFIHFFRTEWEHDRAGILKKIEDFLSWPLFVKPARLGSSIGISKASTPKDLEFAIEVALHYDGKCLVENAVSPLTDITCAVYGPTAEPVTSLLQESAFNKDFFSYEDKYLNDGGAQLGKAKNSVIIPANLDEENVKKIRKIAAEVYTLTGCSGIARVDFLYNRETNLFFANEVNTLPGTLYHHLWKASGLELDMLIEKLLECAVKTHAEKQRTVRTFESEILKYAHSIKLKGK
mgnify:FL=1